jgi:hypothetical protein
MPPDAGALDLPGAPAQVKLKRSPKGKTLQVVFKRPSFFPAVGSADDPAVGTPGGMLIEVFSASEGYAAVDAARGAGTPGWTSYPTKNPPRYKFNDSDAPDAFSAVKKITFVESKVLKTVAKDVALPLAVAQGSVGVRITVGGIRTCAFFDGASVRRDVPGSFTAKIVEGTGLTDCSDASLGGGTCGNDVVEGREECDNSTCAVGFGCGASGTHAACECCDIPCGNTYCCPGDQCEQQPCGSDVPCGRCIPTFCATVSECQSGQACQNGRCCSNPAASGFPEPAAVCDFLGQYTLPCCAPAVCEGTPGDLRTCCYPAGQACTTSGECCRGLSCTAGTCS